MKNKKGFTLIEVIAVIIIIGILMFIAVPNVTNYIKKSRKASYSADVRAFLETIKSKYEMREYGPLLDDNEIMIVPIKSVTFEKGSESESPFGKYDFDKSYIIIVPENEKYNYYATVIDDKKIGMVFEKDSTISEDSIIEKIDDALPTISSFGIPGASFAFDGEEYEQIESRKIKGNDVRDETIKAYVFQKVGTYDPTDPIVLNTLYKISLNGQGADSAGTSYLYEKYGDGWYSNLTATARVTKITVPSKTGFTFLGYYTQTGGQGRLIISSDGNIVSGSETTFNNDATIYASWNQNNTGGGSSEPTEVTCSGGTYLPAGAKTCSTCLANNWCPGGTFPISTGGGLNPCSSGYTNSAGNSSKSSCCKTVTTKYCSGEKINGECYTKNTNSGWAYQAGSQWRCVRGSSDHCNCAAGCINGTTKTINAGQRCDCRAKIAWTKKKTTTCE